MMYQCVLYYGMPTAYTDKTENNDTATSIYFYFFIAKSLFQVYLINKSGHI